MLETYKKQILDIYDDTQEIAEALLYLSSLYNNDDNERSKKELDEFLDCYIRAAAQNEYNADGFRLLYNILQDIALIINYNY